MVAGGAALLIGMGQDLGYSTDPKVIKSVLLNSADKLTGWSHTANHPLDYNQGAGQMDLQNAYLQYVGGEEDPGVVSGTGWDRQQLAYNDENFYRISGNVLASQYLSATLTWDRIVSTNTEDIQNVIYSLGHLDNLDLYLYQADDLITPLAVSSSTIDNVEHVYFSVPQSGQYVLGVRMTGASPGDAETYALAWHALTEPIILPGDVNGDSFVGGDDLTIILTHWGNSGMNREQGDLSGDGFVGGTDYTEVLTYWGTGTPPEAIPEPATLGLLAVLTLAFRLDRTARLSARRGKD